MTTPRRTRGFTLLELTVALSMTVVVMAVTVSVFAVTLRQGKRSHAYSELARDGSFAAQLITQELRHAGMGMPRSFNVVATTQTFKRAIIRPVDGSFSATTSVLGFVGDYARADAQYNAFGFLHNRFTGQTNLIWQTENNGACIPDASGAGASCTNGVDTHSTFFAGTSVGSDVCVAGGVSRVCPWGMRRVLGGEYLQVVAGDGTWVNVRAANSPNAVLASSLVTLPLQTGFPGAWPNNSDTADPIAILGQGWVTSLDRIFYRYDATNKRVLRRQCYGPASPADANWAGGTMTTTAAGTPGSVTGSTCLPEEVIARWVESLTFTFRQTSGADATSWANAARIDFVLQLKYPGGVFGRDVTYSTTGSVNIR